MSEQGEQNEQTQAPKVLVLTVVPGQDEVQPRLPRILNVWDCSSFNHFKAVFGERFDQPLYCVKTKFRFGHLRQPSLTLHSGGLGDREPALASIRNQFLHSSFLVNLFQEGPIDEPNDPSRQPGQEIVERIGPFWHTSAYRFSVEIGPFAVRETFEWRRSMRQNVKDLAGAEQG